MRQSVALALLISSLTLAPTSAPLRAHAQSPGAPAPATAPRPTEQQWIVSDVVGTVAGIAVPRGRAARAVPVRVAPSTAPPGRDRSFTVSIAGGAPIQVVVAGHLWSPDTFGAVAQQLMRPASTGGAAPASPDAAARARLTDLTVATLLDENDRISALLEKDMRSPGAHEAAALLIGAFALRESAGWFHDVRPSLSRMTAHLAVARALRPAGEAGKDGTLARAILTALVGRQREALTMVEAFQRQATTDAERRWVRALTLRITGDWRGKAPMASDSLLERLEHARAVRERLGIHAFLDYRDTLPKDTLTDWQRIAFFDAISVEAGNVFTPDNIDHELAESARIWARFHKGQPSEDVVVNALNERPNSAIREDGTAQVLDWGTWAAHQQRHLAHALIAFGYHSRNRLDNNAGLISSYDKLFGRLTLYPIVLRWIARQPADYQRALAMARALVDTSPALVTQQAWTLLLQKPDFDRPAPLSLDVPWFTPAVPAGTAFELPVRSLRPGNPRPPARAQSAQWALDMPYDHWTLWSKAWLAADGKPTVATVRTALTPLFGYDANALLKMIDDMAMPNSERLDTMHALCALVATHCDRLGELLLVQNDERGAATAYERWAAKSRDRVGVSNGVSWLVRYQRRIGNAARAEALAREAGKVGSYRGLQELAEWLDRAGRYAEAERVYRQIVEQHPDGSVSLGTFLMRQALRTSNAGLQAKASEMLRPLFPGGLEPLAGHSLPVTPGDGVAFATFGPRPTALGMQITDIIVGVNGWRVRSANQYIAVTRFRNDDAMTLTVWRDRRYQELTLRVPERSFGTRFKDHRGAAAP